MFPQQKHTMMRFIATVSILLSVGEAAEESSSPEDPPSPPMWPGRFHALMSQVDHEDYGIVDLWYDYDAGRNLNMIQTQGGEADGPLFSNEQANGTSYYYHPEKPKEKYCDVMDFGVGIITPDWLKDATYLGEEPCGIYQCTKWEQGDVPEAHARFLGLGNLDMAPSVATPSSQPKATTTIDKTQEEPYRNFAPRQVEKALRSAAASAGVSRVRDGAEIQDEQEGVSLRGGDGGPGEESRERGAGDRFLTYWSEKGTDRPVKWRFFTGALFQVIRVDVGASLPDEGYQIPAYCFED